MSAARHAALFLLVALCDGQCLTWCNSYTCSIGYACQSCSICDELEKGDLCAGWCNPYTTMFQHCKGCPGPQVELVVRNLTNGTGACSQRCNPLEAGSFEVTEHGNTYTFSYQQPLFFVGDDPHKIYDQCVEAVGDLYHPTVSFVPHPAPGDSFSQEPYGWCNSKCDFTLFNPPGQNSEVKLYSKPEDAIEKAPPLGCNTRNYYAIYYTPDTFYQAEYCTNRSGALSVDTMYDDCLAVLAMQPAFSPYQCQPMNVTKERKASVVASYEGTEPPNDFYNRRHFSGNPSSGKTNIPIGMVKVKVSSATEPGYEGAAVSETWFDGTGNCEGEPDLVFYFDGVMAYEYESAMVCKDEGLLDATGLAKFNAKYPQYPPASRRALEAGGQGHARRGLHEAWHEAQSAGKWQSTVRHSRSAGYGP